MKKRFIKILCLVLVVTMTVPMLFACKKDDEKVNGDSGAVDTLDGIAGIPQQNYGKDFNVYQGNFGVYENYFWSDGVGSSNISKANYERELAIEEHLGIEIYQETYEIKEGGLFAVIEQQSLAGLDDYQVVLTHQYVDLFTLAFSGHLSDIDELPGVSMNEEYWDISHMEATEFQGHKYLGSSSFMLHQPTMVMFNKKMANSFQDVGEDKMYEHVREKTWTIEQMWTYAKMVDISGNENLRDPIEGTYGYAAETNWQMNAFPTASGYLHMTRNSQGDYELKNFNETMFNIFREIVVMTDSEYYYGWDWSKQDRAIRMSTGRAFFSTVGTEEVITNMANTVDPLGILPYPTLEKGMDYISLDWSGFFIDPTTVTDKKMVGETLELLSYYGETKIKTEYYDVVLGLRAADEPQDSEMLELIFDSMVVEPALAYCNSGGSAISSVFYTIPYMILNNQKAMASWYAGCYGNAKKMVDQINGIQE